MLSTVNQVPVVRNAKHSNAENTFWDSHLKESSANQHEAFKEKSRPLCQQLVVDFYNVRLKKIKHILLQRGSFVHFYLTEKLFPLVSRDPGVEKCPNIYALHVEKGSLSLSYF